jgi:MraZ protein
VETGSDKQFRVQLTPEHRRYAGIADEVVVCGCGKHVELWAPEALEAYKKQNDRVEDLISAGAALLPSGGGLAPRDGDAGVSQTGPA